VILNTLLFVGAENIDYLLSTKTNYNDWAMLMMIKMEVQLFWVIVVHGNVELLVDCMALNAI
jgi:hypothetical protein